MSRKFNGGRGANICDGCSVMVVDGDKVLKTHRWMPTAASAIHFCNARCMDRHASDPNTPRRRALVLAQEVERLRILDESARLRENEPAVASAFIEHVSRHLVTREEKAE